MSEMCVHEWEEVKHENFNKVCTKCKQLKTEASYEKLAPIEGGHGGCLCCGYQYDHLPMDSLIAVGFGYARVTKGTETVYDEMDTDGEEESLWTAQKAEDEAVKAPDHDWRIHLVAPLSERHYQRQGDDLWVLYEKGIGFA
jgi:hypothetical protein